MSKNGRYTAQELYDALLPELISNIKEIFDDLEDYTCRGLDPDDLEASIRKMYPTPMHLVDLMCDLSWDIPSAIIHILTEITSDEDNLGIKQVDIAMHWDT